MHSFRLWEETHIHWENMEIVSDLNQRLSHCEATAANHCTASYEMVHYKFINVPEDFNSHHHCAL